MVMKCARVPLVMNIFRPFSTQVSPSRTARVVIPATSEPASGSVSAIAPIFSPLIAGRRYRSFSASVPNSPMAGVHMWVWTAIAIGIEPAPHRASSSMNRRLLARSPPEPPQASG